jgi:site-specific recombinase XerD
MGNKKNPEGGKDMNIIAIRASQDIRDMAAILATFPEPGRWTQEQKAQAVQFAALLETAQNMIAAKNLAGIDWQSEKAVFLANAGRTNSDHTRTGYAAALSRLDAWAARQAVNPLELSPAQADDFIYSLRGRAAASVRLDASAASSFYTWLERRHAGIKNPFRGTKARPAEKAARETAIPEAGEVETILRELPADLSAAASVMACRGLRAGALPTLSIAGGKYTGRSKGKDIKGTLPTVALERIKAAALPLRSPFAGILPNTLEKRIARAIEKLFKAGKVKAAYSCHDLRHFYAVSEYRKDKDIHRLCGLLGHASIAVTETYLKSINVKL